MLRRAAAWRVLPLLLFIALGIDLFAQPPEQTAAAGGRRVAASGREPASTARRTRSATVRGAEHIHAAQLRDYLTFLAADELEGRDTPSRGLNIAARFLASHLSRLGLKPAGDEGFLQRIDMTRRIVEAEGSTLTLDGRDFEYGRDFVGSSPGSAEGPLVYVGHGHVIRKRSMDAYAGVDVTGKILIANAGLPEGVTRQDLRGDPGEAWESPQTYAARHGALGVVLIPDFRTLSSWQRVRARAEDRGSVSVDLFSKDQTGAVPVITASPELVSALFAGERTSADEVFRRAQDRKGGTPFDLRPNRRLRMMVNGTTERVPAYNVVAIYQGSDPVLAKEYVALGAHYDHVGLATNGEDRIYNGADDDGSGTTALLAMAEALARGRVKTKRSILFVWHAGEERGLLGSRYFVSRPAVPLDRIVAQLNVDMIGRSRAEGDTSEANGALTGPNEIYVIGSKMMSGALGEISERVNRSYLNLSFNYKYDDPDDPSRFFFRSDHYNYARHGIPIIFYFSGVHEDYHQVSDHVEKIDFGKMERVTRTIYATALALADAPTRPAVERALPTQFTEPD